jgi:hypothetical protein
MKKIILVFAIIFSTSIVFTACKSEKKEVEKEQVSTDKVKTVYQCPMKCEKEKTYEKEGICPVCEMKLREKKTSEEDENHENEHES